jgi:hypothetical protein
MAYAISSSAWGYKGYKGYMIKEYFANYFLHMSDVTLDPQQNSMEVHQRYAEPWRVTLVETGEHTLTGGRLKRVAAYSTMARPSASPMATAFPISISAPRSIFIGSMASWRPSLPCSRRDATGRSSGKATRCADSRKKPRVTAVGSTADFSSCSLK